MTCLHVVRANVDTVDYATKDLLIGKHPIAIQQKKDRRVGKEVQSILCQHVVHCRWHLIRVCKSVPFDAVNDDVTNDSDWEQDWKARSIKHCHVSYIEDSGVLVVYDEFRARVQVHISVDLSLFCLVKSLVWVRLPALIISLLKPLSDYRVKLA